MATILNADTVVGGAIVTADASGLLDFQSAGNKRVFLESAKMIRLLRRFINELRESKHDFTFTHRTS